jgi:hypothetical protein
MFRAGLLLRRTDRPLADIADGAQLPVTQNDTRAYGLTAK